MPNTYIDAITYSKSATGLVLASLQYGNIGRINACAVGATSLTLTAATAVALAQYDDLYVFDGPNSETLKVGLGGAAQGATTIPLQSGTQYAHGGGVAYCTDGSQGSLGQAIFEASRWVEDICHQALWSTAYTGEILTMPTMRAAIDNKWNLHFRPRHFPITVFTSISIQASQLYSATLDPTQAIVDSDQQTVDIPNINLLSTGGLPPPQGYPFIWQAINRQSNAWITLAYTAGYAVGQLPWAVVRAAMLLTNEQFGLLENPMGADSIQQVGRNVNFVVRGDTSGDSLLVKQAKHYLDPYIVQSF